MARKKRGGDSGGGGGGDWLNTYADMVTLLLTFFILLFSMSSLDAAKFNMLVMAFASDGESSEKIVMEGQREEGEGEGHPMDGSANAADVDLESLSDVFEMLQQMIEEQGLQDSVELAQGDGVIFIRFGDDMLFTANSAELLARDKEILRFVGEGIKSVQGDVKSINIVGHTAAIPGNPDYAVSDRKLSNERAEAVLTFFEDGIGVDGEKLFSTGLGKWQPIAENDTPEGQRKNRRVEILISSESNSLTEQLDNVYEKLVE